MEEFVYRGRGQTVPKDVLSVRFHPSVTEVEKNAFAQCTNLRTVVLNDGLAKIGDDAFANCTSLQSIKLPSTVTEIGDAAFCACSSLREAGLNEGLEKIGNHSFCACSALESITFPSTLTEIDLQAFYFYGCSNLKGVVLKGLQIKTMNNCSEIFDECLLLESFKFPIISTRLENIIQTGYYPLSLNKFDEIRNIALVLRSKRSGQVVQRISGIVERNGTELFVSAESMRVGAHRRMPLGTQIWGVVKNYLLNIVSLIRFYEIKEETTQLELAWWKANLDQKEDHPINREAYRIEVPGPVKDTILQYL